MKTGKRTKKRIAANKILKERFTEWGIFYCELRYEGCWGQGQGFAHSKKSRFLITDQDFLEVALACNSCHNILEYSGHQNMYEVIVDTIKKRERSV